MYSLLKYKKQKTVNFLTNLLFAASIFYFSYHAISGERGIFTMLKLIQQIDKVDQENNQLKQERQQLESKVGRLYENSLDLDLLDEQARKILGYSKSNEIVLIVPDRRKKPTQND